MLHPKRQHECRLRCSRAITAQLNRTARQFLLAPLPCNFLSIDRAHRWYPNHNCNRSGTISTSIEEGPMQSIAADAICGDRNVFLRPDSVSINQASGCSTTRQAFYSASFAPKPASHQENGIFGSVPPGDVVSQYTPTAYTRFESRPAVCLFGVGVGLNHFGEGASIRTVRSCLIAGTPAPRRKTRHLESSEAYRSPR